MRTFKRRDTHKYHRLGKKVKAKQKWRRPKGRDNKMREGRRGYQNSPSIGMKTPRKKEIEIRISNEKELLTLKKGDAVIINGRVGKKKRTAIESKAKETGIKIINESKERKIMEKKK